MFVHDCQDYNPNHPELYTWGHIDSPTLSDLAFTLSQLVTHDLKQDRILVPGLREALNRIATIAKV